MEYSWIPFKGHIDFKQFTCRKFYVTVKYPMLDIRHVIVAKWNYTSRQFCYASNGQPIKEEVIAYMPYFVPAPYRF